MIEVVTAHTLIECCLGTPHDPLLTWRLTRCEIEDKSKTDALLKLISISQISWLVLSVAAYKACHQKLYD
jgi:hypothetical protein